MSTANAAHLATDLKDPLANYTDTAIQGENNIIIQCFMISTVILQIAILISRCQVTYGISNDYSYNINYYTAIAT